MAYNRKYIGARYVPKFADPIDWDDDYSYEPLMIVMHEGDTYTSAQFVPAGIAITNTDYWVKTADYNAQIAQFADDLDAFELQLDSIGDDVDALENRFPVSISDGGTGITSLQANKIMKANSAGNAIEFLSSSDLASFIGNNPVARAIADEDGNDIADTYATKNDVFELEVITDYTRVLEIPQASANTYCSLIDNFKFIRFGKWCYLSARVYFSQDLTTNHSIKRLASFKNGYKPVKTSPMATFDYMTLSTVNAVGKQLTVISFGQNIIWLGVYPFDYELENVPKEGNSAIVNIAYFCE